MFSLSAKTRRLWGPPHRLQRKLPHGFQDSMAAAQPRHPSIIEPVSLPKTTESGQEGRGPPNPGSPAFSWRWEEEVFPEQCLWMLNSHRTVQREKPLGGSSRRREIPGAGDSRRDREGSPTWKGVPEALRFACANRELRGNGARFLGGEFSGEPSPQSAFHPRVAWVNGRIVRGGVNLLGRC